MDADQSAQTRWSSFQAYGFASVSLAVGIACGYLIHGPAKPVAIAGQEHPPIQQTNQTPAMPTPEQMKHMAEKQAAPIVEKLKAEPQNAELLAQAAKTYFNAHQFQDAITYAQRAVKADPKKVSYQADLATYLYVSGDADKAIATLQDALELEPNNPQMLFNLGMIRFKAKNDAPGATAAWKQLLKNNPKLPEDRKKVVEAAIENASQNSSTRPD